MKLASISPSRNSELISGLPTNPLHSPHPEGEKKETAPLSESTNDSNQSEFSLTSTFTTIPTQIDSNQAN